MNISVDKLQAYPADHYCGWSTEQSLFTLGDIDSLSEFLKSKGIKVK